MNTAIRPLSWALLWSLVAALAMAQVPPGQAPATATSTAPATPTPGADGPKTPAKSTAQIDAGEPRADTSATPGPSAGAPAAATRAGADRAAASPTDGAAPPPARTSTPTARKPAEPGQKAPGSADRLQLGTATVTGDREQPKVMYIVPWKKSDIGDLSGKPMNSLLDEALAPVDRDEFKREVVYFDAMNADMPQNGAQKPASPQGEK